MHVVIRRYSGGGASELADLLAERDSEVKDLLSSVPGFASYAGIRTEGGFTSFTMCEDKAGTDESSRRAAGWVKDNAETAVDPPDLTEGETVVQF